MEENNVSKCDDVTRKLRFFPLGVNRLEHNACDTGFIPQTLPACIIFHTGFLFLLLYTHIVGGVILVQGVQQVNSAKSSFQFLVRSTYIHLLHPLFHV